MKYILYLVFFLLAFSNTSIMGHLYLVEIPVIIGAFMLPFKKDIKSLKLNALDYVVIVYVVFSLVSVAVGLETLYESARHYRLMVLTPFLIYLVIRFGASSLEELRKAVFFIIPGTIWQGILFLQYFMLHGERPVGVEGTVSTITLSVLISLSLFIMVFNFPKKPKRMLNIIRYGLILVLFVMLIVSGTRAALLGVVVMLPVIAIFWEKKQRRVLVGRAMISAITGLLIIMISGSLFFSDIQLGVKDRHERGTVVNRLFDVEMYLWDISGRIAFWGRVTKHALESPIFGNGAASHKIGRSGGTTSSMGSSHNILVSALVISGVPGLLILLAMIWMIYRVFAVVEDAKWKHCVLGKSVLGIVSILLMVAITNDFSGGRIFIWLLLLALGSRMLNELPRISENDDKELAKHKAIGHDQLNMPSIVHGVRLKA